MARRVALGFAIPFCLSVLAWVGVSPVYAQSCSTSISNKVGDTITVMATLSTTDPNESGEGEPLLISTLSGASFSDSTYSIPQTFIYTATVANDTITGTEIGFDGDESCALSATSKQNAWFPPQAKQTAGVLAAGGATVSGAAWLVAELCTAGVVTGPVCTLPAGVVAASAALFTGLAGLVAADPPDNNYTQFAAPVFPSVPFSYAPGTPIPIVINVTSLVKVRDLEIGYTGALYTTLNRASTADANGATFWVNAQTAYSKFLQQRLAAVLALDARLSKQTSAALANTQYDATLTTDEAIAFEEQVAVSGLPAADLAELQALGVTPDLVSSITSFTISQNIDETAGPFSATLANSAFISSLYQGVATYGGNCEVVYLVDASLGTSIGQPGYNPAADLNNDGVVNLLDLAIALKKSPGSLVCVLTDIDALR